jgi:hypothetical protein
LNMPPEFCGSKSMKKISLATLLLVLVAMMSLAPVQVAAQAVFGGIAGTVTDPQGAAVPNASVTVTDMDKGTSQKATTNESGTYNVTHLIPGRYKVRVEAQGFKAYEATDLQVFADQSIRLNPQVQLGGTAETVTVTAEDVPLVKTDRADVATTFTAKQVTELPISANRNFTELQLATPGTQTLSWQHAASENPQQSTQIMVNGQHFSGTSYQLDGTDNRDPILGIIVVNPNLESVTETKITTQSYDAEFGQAVAAVITAQTKSGSNDVHGSAFWFRRNDQMQAKDPFQGSDPTTGRVLPDSLWNQFGGGIGGPIVKDKWFIFGDFQGTRQKAGRAVRVTVPTQLVRDTCLNPASLTCDFSDYLQAAEVGQLYNPYVLDTNGNPTKIDGNVFLKADLPLSAPAVALASLLPAPNNPGASPTFRENYIGSGTGGFDANQFDIRSDYTLSEAVHVFGRYSYGRYDLTGVSVFDTDQVALGGRGLGLNGFGAQSKYRNHSLATGFDWSLSTSLLTDFRFGWFRYRGNVLPNGLGTSPAADLGIPGVNLDDFYTSGMPAFFINGGNTTADQEFGYGLSDRLNRCNCPLDQNEDQFQFVNNWTKIQGNHQFKFGADIRYARNLRVPSDAHRAGEISFTNGGTGFGSATGSGVALASFLAGRVQKFERYVSTATDAGERQKRWFFYGQDTFRATPKLTLNYGLRWEIYFPQTVTGDGKGGWPDLATGRMLIAGLGGVNRSGNVENSFTNFAPRLGISYQWTPKTVVRMGYGRSFDIGVFGSTFGHTVTQNLPVLARQSVSAGDFDTVFQLEDGPPAFVFPEPGPDGTLGPEQLHDVTIRVPNRKMQLPTIDAWNLTVQHAITPTMSAEIAYVGNKGTHTFAGNNPDQNRNQASIENFSPGRNTVLFKPYYQLYGWTQDITSYFNEASTSYNALQLRLEKRFSQGWSVNAHYTWSKAFNHGNDYYTVDPSVNWGRFDYNRDHVFVMSNLVELPFGRGKPFASGASGIVEHIIGGWQVNSVLNISSGLPWTPAYAGCGNDQDVGVCRPNAIGDFSLSDGEFVANSPGAPGGTVVGLFEGVPTLTNPAQDPNSPDPAIRCPATPGDSAGPWQRPGCGVLGDTRRNSVSGPRLWNMDASLFKNFKFNERINAQLRLEAFNVFNHRNNGTPGVFWTAFGFAGTNCIDCSDSGVIRALGAPMRQMQVGLRVTF